MLKQKTKKPDILRKYAGMKASKEIAAAAF